MSETLTRQEYLRQGKKPRGLIRAYLSKVTGRSRAQVTRLIRQYVQTGEVRGEGGCRHRFASKYSAQDIALLAEVDRAHERLSGPATKRILEREWQNFGRGEFQRLAGISVSHLYNLRRRDGYRKRAAQFEKTRPVNIAIGERRRPDPGARPGYLRVDTVHQGDGEGHKGVYHIFQAHSWIGRCWMCRSRAGPCFTILWTGTERECFIARQRRTSSLAVPGFRPRKVSPMTSTASLSSTRFPSCAM